MNPNAQFERDLEQWLQTEAPASAPAGFHASVIDRARTLRQRPGWATSPTARQLGRRRGITLLAAAALLLVGGALAAGSGILRLLTVVPPVPEPSVVAVATASPNATFPRPSESSAPSASPIPGAGPGGAWIATGTMGTPRSNQLAVRLLDGRVLVAGGQNASGDDLTSAELYDPATGTWSATGKLVKPADADDDPTLLGDGRVLVTGFVSSAQLYDPAKGTWTATGNRIRNTDHAAYTALRDGRVLAVGIGGAEVYDPGSGTWTATRKMITPRNNPIATLLSDGRVLVAGGEVGPGSNWTNAAEVFDPVTGSWTGIADLPSGTPVQSLGIAVQLPDGKVLVYSYVGAEVYDPTTGTWTARPKQIKFLPRPRALLSDGTVLAGECADALYDLRTGSLTTASSMLRCSDRSSFTLLLDGTVLKAGDKTCNEGGSGVCVSTGAAELYVPAGVSLPPFSFPNPAPLVFPDPTPTPTPAPLRPPAAGPVPPNARSWTITVDNESSEPATLFVAEGDDGDTFRLVGSATPNVVPAGTSMKVTFLFPAKGSPDVGWISVNPRIDEGADVGSTGADDIGRPGKIWITDDCGGCWVGPAQ